MTEKAVNFFVTMRCLMICKDENCTPTLRLRGGKLPAGVFDIGSNPPADRGKRGEVAGTIEAVICLRLVRELEPVPCLHTNPPLMRFLYPRAIQAHA